MQEWQGSRQILLVGYLPDFTPRRLISEPIVQGEAAVMGRQGCKKCSLKVLKSQNHGSKESRSLILCRISDNYLTKEGTHGEMKSSHCITTDSDDQNQRLVNSIIVSILCYRGRLLPIGSDHFSIVLVFRFRRQPPPPTLFVFSGGLVQS